MNDRPALHVTVAISGWLSQEDDMVSTWQHLAEFPGQHKTYALRWDAGSYASLGSEVLAVFRDLTRIGKMKPLSQIEELSRALGKNPFSKASKQA